MNGEVVPLAMDPAFKGALIGLVVALTGLASAAGGWLMKGAKARREAESAPGATFRRDSDRKLVHLEGEVKGLSRDLKELGGKADDLAAGVERASNRIDAIDEKVNDAATEVAKLTTDMEWVKEALRAIKTALGAK